MARRDAQGYRIDAHGRRMSPERARYFREQEDRRRQDEQRLIAASKSQSSLKTRRNSQVSNSKYKRPEPANEDEARAQRLEERVLAERVTHALLAAGKISTAEARLVGQTIMRASEQDMTGEEWVRFRESPAYSEWERTARRTPDDVSSDTHIGNMDAATRKMMAKAWARAWSDGVVDDETALKTIGSVVTIKDTDDMNRVWLDTNFDPGGEGSAVSFKAPPPKMLPEHVPDGAFKYSAADDRANSPSARQRRREAKDAEKMKANEANKKLVDAERSKATTDGKVYYERQEESLGHILDGALDSAERQVAAAYLDATPISGGGDAGGGSGEGGAAA